MENFSWLVTLITVVLGFIDHRINWGAKKKLERINQKNTLILNFLGAVNTYPGKFGYDELDKALKACGEVLPVCTSEQKVAVNRLIKSLQEMQGIPKDSAFQHVRESVYEVNQKFDKLNF